MNNINKRNPNDYVGIIYERFIATKEQVKIRKEQIRKCEHKFVKLQDDIYECLLCGVTNKFREVETQISKSIISLNLVTIETEMYKELTEIEGSTDRINLISKIAINSKHARLLYEIAKLVEPNLPDEEIAKVMYILNELQNEEEKNNLASIDEAKLLIAKYSRYLKCNDKNVIIDKPPRIVRTRKVQQKAKSNK